MNQPNTPEAEKLAEKIVDVLGMVWDGGGREKAVQKVASLISGALEDEKSVAVARALLDAMPKLDARVKEAVAKERERCLKIAEVEITRPGQTTEHRWCAESIAAGIRSGEAAGSDV